jgi:hypothetical protein
LADESGLRGGALSPQAFKVLVTITSGEEVGPHASGRHGTSTACQTRLSREGRAAGLLPPTNNRRTRTRESPMRRRQFWLCLLRRCWVASTAATQARTGPSRDLPNCHQISHAPLCLTRPNSSSRIKLTGIGCGFIARQVVLGCAATGKAGRIVWFVWGSRQQQTKLGDGYFNCPGCNRRQPATLSQVQTRQHVYFIPVGQGDPAGPELYTCATGSASNAAVPSPASAWTARTAASASWAERHRPHR